MVKNRIERPDRVEWKVICSLILVIGLLEVGMRGFGDNLSKDLKHFGELPSAAKRLSEVEPDQRLLIVGNSLARAGLDAGLVRQEYPGAEFFHPDSSSITEWAWGTGRYFWDAGAPPGKLWIVTARPHLLDSIVNPEKLGVYFVGRGDLLEAMSSREGHDSAIRLLLGHFSALLANRDRVRPILGYKFFPGFESAWPQLVVPAMVGGGNKPENGLGTANSLRRLIERARKSGTKVTVIAIPMPDDYEIPTVVNDLLNEFQVPLIDLSSLEGLGKHSFPDGYHLDSDGARKTTVELLQRLR